MGSPREPSPVKLFVALLCNHNTLFPPVEADLSELFGAIDSASAVLPWTVTNYYAEEMGPELQRRFVSFAALVEPSQLPAIKRRTQCLEAKYCWTLGAQQGRRANLDPGYVEAGKVVLASTKNATHRLYLGDGLYGEATLQFHHGTFAPFAHTYPDYRWDATLEYFGTLRSIYLQQLRACRPSAG